MWVNVSRISRKCLSKTYSNFLRNEAMQFHFKLASSIGKVKDLKFDIRLSIYVIKSYGNSLNLLISARFYFNLCIFFKTNHHYKFSHNLLCSISQNFFLVEIGLILSNSFVSTIISTMKSMILFFIIASAYLTK